MLPQKMLITLAILKRKILGFLAQSECSFKESGNGRGG
jgi:hypothetical protein